MDPCPECHSLRTQADAIAIAARLEQAFVAGESEDATFAALKEMGLEDGHAGYCVAIIASVLFRVQMERGPMPQAWEDADRQTFDNVGDLFDSWTYRELVWRLRARIPAPPGTPVPTGPPRPRAEGALREELPPMRERLFLLALYCGLVVFPLFLVGVLWWRRQ